MERGFKICLDYKRIEIFKGLDCLCRFHKEASTADIILVDEHDIQRLDYQYYMTYLIIVSNKLHIFLVHWKKVKS